ncbi:MAG: hypothetical protein ACLRVT_00870 [Oscillospiraceae bacterium]
MARSWLTSSTTCWTKGASSVSPLPEDSGFDEDDTGAELEGACGADGS